MFLHVNKKLMLWVMVYSNFSPLFLTLCWGLQTNSKSSGPVPIPHSAWPDRFPAKEHCSRCGLCETTFVSEVTSSCAFIGDGMSRIDHMEEKVHGRRRKLNDEADSADELRFGVHEEPMMLAKGSVIGAQWTGVVTSIAISMLEANAVDAVVCIASESDVNETEDDDDKMKNVSWSEPRPIIARNVEQVLKGKGVKPALAPSLAVLDEIKSDPSIKRLLFCGVGCAVQAFRAVQDKLGLDEVFVLGTNCADNSPTPEAARSFIEKGTKLDPSSVQGYEFMQDFRVHVKLAKDSEDDPLQYKKIPYFCLPGSVAETAIAQSCLACFDYTNSLADLVVGYMASPMNEVMSESMQSISIRNERGNAMLKTALENNRVHLHGTASGTGSHEQITISTLLNDNIIQKMLVEGKVRESGMPKVIGELVAYLITMQGPKGVNFAKYSIDYHVLRNYLHCINVWGKSKTEKMMPEYVKELVEKYEEDSSVSSLINDISGIVV